MTLENIAIDGTHKSSLPTWTVDEFDRLNNWLQALALLQFAAGAEVTAVSRDVRYIRRKADCGSIPDANV
jgi:hypothetical protein